jgi:hypothetical protein
MTIAWGQNSTDDEVLTSAMHLFYLNGRTNHWIEGPFGLGGRAGARFPGEAHVELILDRLLLSILHLHQCYHSVSVRLCADLNRM